MYIPKAYVLIAILLLGIGAGGAYTGFKAGQYRTAEAYQRMALAKGCARIDPMTVRFTWQSAQGLQLPVQGLKH